MVSSVFFLLAKLVGVLIRLETVLLLCLVLGWRALRRSRRGRGRVFFGAAMALGLALFLLPVGNLLLLPLERQYPARPPLGQVEGVIILGGAEVADTVLGQNMPQVNGAADRLVEAKALSVALPDAVILWSGGAARLSARETTAHVAGVRVLEALDIPADRLLIEDQSRNTAENAALSRQIAPATLTGQWVLVTSAFHMPRAVAVFCQAGWTRILPWPVDHRASRGLVRFDRNLLNANIAIKEWVGLIGYRLTGRISRSEPDTCLSAQGQ